MSYTDFYIIALQWLSTTERGCLVCENNPESSSDKTGRKQTLI